MSFFEITVFSNPVIALVGEGGLLRYGDLSRAATYDEQLIKPALLLADMVTLHSHRVDLILDQRRDHDSAQKQAPLFAQLVSMSKSPDREMLKVLGLTESALLTSQEIEKFERQSKIESERLATSQSKFRSTNREIYQAEKERERATRDEDNHVWEEFWDRADPFRQALTNFFDSVEASLSSSTLDGLSKAGLLVEVPWDRLPKSRPRQVLDNLGGPNTEYERAFETMVADVATSTESVMLGSEVQASLAKFGSSISGLESASTVGGAVDLMRMVAGLSELPLDEIPDLRTELDPYLGPFRSFMLEVSSTADIEKVDDAERTRLLKLAWEREVEPAVQEMHARLESASFVRNAVDVFANSGETTRTLGVAIGIAAVAGFTGISTLAAAAAAAPPLLKAFLGSIRAKQDVRRSRAYFVHAIDKSKVLAKARRRAVT